MPPARVTSTPIGYYQQAKVDDLTIAFNVDPDQPGINTFTAFITAGGQPVTETKSVSLEFTPLSGMMPASSTDLTNLGNGTYSLRGGYFGMPDTWDVKLVVVRQEKFDVYADFKVDNTAPTGPAVPWQTVAAGLFIIMAFCYAFAFRVLDRNTRRWVRLGLVPAGVLVLISVVLIIQMSFFST